MATTIKLKNGSGAPLTGDLVQGEPALDLTNKRLYTEDSGGSVIEVGTNPTSLTTGTFTSTGIDDNATSTAVTIDASGNVGIGTTTPNAAYALDVVGSIRATNSAGSTIIVNRTSDTGSVEFQYSGTQTAQFSALSGGGVATYVGSTPIEAMRIDASGNVGIGTGSPSGLLKTLNIDGGAAGSSIALDGGSNFAVIYTGATIGDPTSLFSNTGFKFATATAKNATGFAEAMRIDSSGNVLVGTTDGAFINGGGIKIANAAAARLKLCDSNSAGTGSADGFELTQSGTAAYIYQNENDFMAFGTNALERMRINANGNVGIGTSSPSYKLMTVAPSGTQSILLAGQSGLTNGFTINSDGSQLTYSFLTGNVGIGTASPSALLDLVGGAATPLVLELNSANSNCDITMQSASTSSVTRLRNGTNDFQVHTNGVERMRLDSSGNLLIGTTTVPTTIGGSAFVADTGNRYVLILGVNTSAPRNLAQFNNSLGNVGSISTASYATSYNTSSDVRLKENIVDAPSASDDIDAIQIRSYDWKADGQHQKYGVVAQELVNVAPEAVSQGETEEDTWGVDCSKLVPMLVKEIQELRARVAQLEEA
jgi:hypothetical protein